MIDREQVMAAAMLLRRAAQHVSAAGLLLTVQAGALAEQAEVHVRAMLQEAIPHAEAAVEKLRELEETGR